MPRTNRRFLPGSSGTSSTAAIEGLFYLNCARSPPVPALVFEAKKRFGVSVLNYMVTSKHIQLLVKDSVQAIRSKRHRQYHRVNRQPHRARILPAEKRNGAFWEDRYDTTAIEADEHPNCGPVYIVLNMVRAGAVRHPSGWACGG
jgi:REP-associated tyrosine transposase